MAAKINKCKYILASTWRGYARLCKSCFTGALKKMVQEIMNQSVNKFGHCPVRAICSKKLLSRRVMVSMSFQSFSNFQSIHSLVIENLS